MALRQIVSRAGGSVRNRFCERSCRRTYKNALHRFDDPAPTLERVKYCAQPCGPGAMQFPNVWKKATSEWRSKPELIPVHTCTPSLRSQTLALPASPAPPPLYPTHCYYHYPGQSGTSSLEMCVTIRHATSPPRSHSTSTEKLPETSTKISPDSAETDTSAEPYEGEGPSVPPDHSVTAEEMRHNLAGMVQGMGRLAVALAVSGCVQMAHSLWATFSVTPPHYESLLQTAPALAQSLVLAALLYRALKPIAFFMKVEEKSRLRIVTLALQTTKAFNTYFKRASIAAVVVCISAMLALINDILPSLPPHMRAMWDNGTKAPKEV